MRADFHSWHSISDWLLLLDARSALRWKRAGGSRFISCEPAARGRSHDFATGATRDTDMPIARKMLFAAPPPQVPASLAEGMMPYA